MKRNEIEIMAPAGSYESLMAAIGGGADSVYFGAEQLNMRAASSNNFTLSEELPHQYPLKILSKLDAKNDYKG